MSALSRRRGVHAALMYGVLLLFGLFMVYPLLWLVLSAFKTDAELLGSISLLPREWVWDSFAQGWKGSGQYSFSVFYLNTFTLVVPTVLLTVASSTVTAYGFARFAFPGRRVVFMIMLSTMMLPAAVIVIPRFILFHSLRWIDTYLPFIVPAAFASQSFFVFMLVQFFRGIPRELDESAHMDGCGSLRILTGILLPLAKPALFSAAIFQFVWTWNDFFNSLIYINSVRKFTVSLALRMSLDISTTVTWNRVIAMSVAAMAPSVIFFFAAQKQFVEGIATTGLKG